MEDILNMLIPYGYESPTEKQVRNAKKWTLLRNENAARLSSLIEARLQDAARELTKIGYKYNCKPEDFQFSQDKNLREDVAELMEDLEDDIMGLVQEYSLNETEDKERRNKVLPWLIALHSKNTKNLAGTLHERIRQFLFDTEAQIAAMRMANYGQTKAIGRILSTMHAVYAAPEVLAAFNKRSAARFIKSHGVHEGNVGLSSSGAVNVENFGDMTARMAWSRLQLEGAKEEGKAGFIVSRGSTFPCDLCDSKCGFHLIDQTEFLPPFHGHCCCYTVFVNMDSQNRDNEAHSQYQRLKDDGNFYDVEYNAENGGLKATHIGHNFDKTGGVFEKEVQNAAYKAGNIVILGNERFGTFNERFTEGTWNGLKFEVAGCQTATSNNILAGLSHCASKGDTKVAVLDFPNNNFNQDTFERTIGRYKGLKKIENGQYLEFERIICVQDGNIIVNIPFP